MEEQGLYPLKFVPILKERIWGGNRLTGLLGKKASTRNIGESWELSGLSGDISKVANGFLKGNNLQEIAEVYMGDLLGDKVYDHFGVEFPLLIKFIDAHDDLSIQVHPNDELAAARHNAYGKTEMWYVVEAADDSRLIVGFNRPMNRETYLEAVADKRLKDILNVEKVERGDVFFIPAGRIHAICKNIIVAEIQQTSDITYRIYDWDRVDAAGKPREMHTELAVDAIDYAPVADYKTHYTRKPQGTTELVECPYFNTQLICLQSDGLEKDYHELDSFVIYICTAGSFRIRYGQGEELPVKRGETVLIPAMLQHLQLIPTEPTELLEVYIA